MAAINFPSSPAENDTFTHEGRTWLYTGGVWISQTASVSPGEGDVMSPGVAVVSGNFVSFDGTTGTAIEDSGSNAASFATAAQGALADTALQPADVGTAAAEDVGYFATAAQGALADSAIQPADLGDSALLDVGTTAGTVAAGDHIQNLASGVTGTLPVANGGTGITSLGTGVATFLGTPSSANLAAALTDETGSGAAVFGTAPALSNPTITNYVETVYAPSAGTAFTVDLANGTVQKLTSSGNLTITLPASVSGKSFIIIVAYGGTHTLTWAGATIKWNGGSAPTATSVNAKFDIFTFFQDGTNTYGSVFGQNF